MTKMNADLRSGSPAARDCGCHQCYADRDERVWHMIVCHICGNKRCPHATNHRHTCTGSNEPGQAGSVYGGWTLRASGSEPAEGRTHHPEETGADTVRHSPPPPR